ncbi:CocE/NonD family hydrolase C-terminal non-catalytic domain-containing protein [Streptomyces sp. SR27]|uniref:CocE/NonD family hydrolase n=2 Tax=unclassified Streptomyces TaxID=2593676 RepID=UPI00295BE9A1|nr:CocE/NonD family hydrolase [Streptomyces sp. SR27]MDV9192381.1 CocE/NonD family hydrolase C-terminal non-catalytic domain-containing protein [Streptomyces sp. SR27]
MPQEKPFTTGSSEHFPGFPDVTAGLTAAETSRITGRGLWAADGTVDPGAVRLGQTLANALLGGTADGGEGSGAADGGEGTGGAGELLPAELAACVREVRGLAVPAYHRIEGATQDVRLSAFSLRQLGPGPHPLVVVPAGWTPFGWPLFLWSYLVLAHKGYHVLAYTPRGLGVPGLPSTSSGFVDVAGPHDWADGSAVIDFAVDHFAPSAVGFMGESYGSGISQLVAAHDDRVAAVVALSTWGNLATSLYDHDTRHLAAVKALLALTGGPVESKFDEDNQRILADFQADRNLEDVVDWGRLRAPESYLELTNDKGTPTFFSNTWHESLFAVNQVLETFNGLEVPKRLNMWIGDHAAPEGPALIGPPAAPGEVNLPMAEAYAWLDHHLKGEPNGVADWPKVCNQVMFTYTTEPALAPGTGEPTGENRIVTPARRELRSDWSEVTRATEVFGLTGDGAGGADGLLLPVGGGAPETEGTGWRRAFLAGVDTEATAMDAIMKTGRAEWAGNPKIYDTRKIDRRHALAWTTEQLLPSGGEETAGRRVRGIPRLRLTVRSTATSASLYAHLLDVAEDDTARIISHEPLNVYGLTPDQDTTVTWRLQAAAYDIPSGHRLMLVVDSKDPLYGDASVTWTQTVVGSPAGEPSFLELPLG